MNTVASHIDPGLTAQAGVQLAAAMDNPESSFGKPRLSRRSFIASAAAGGLMLGFDLPSLQVASAQTSAGSPEINAWVVVRPDDSVVIRIARSEMGHGKFVLPWMIKWRLAG